MVSQPKMSFKHSGLPSTPPLKPVVYQHHDIARYVFLKSPDLNMYHFDETRPMISITPSQTDILSQAAQISFLGLRQPELLSTATVSLRTARSDLPHHVRAGLALYWDPVRAIRVYVDFASSAIVYNAVNVAAGLEDELRCPINPLPTSVSFQIRSLQQFYEFAYRTPEGQWKVMAQLDSKEMTFRDFTGPVFGIFASTDVDPTNVQSVDFFDFEIFENDKNSHL